MSLHSWSPGEGARVGDGVEAGTRDLSGSEDDDLKQKFVKI